MSQPGTSFIAMTTLPIGRLVEARDLFEAHLTVTDLERSIAFYRNVVGLRLAHVVGTRRAAFFWVGTPGKAMLGVWEASSAPQRVTLHVAFRVSVADLMAAPGALRTAGVTPLDFDGHPTDQPVVFGWMPAASIFFHDPDDNLLEYIAMLSHEPRPEVGVVSWRMWQLTASSDVTAS